MKISKANIASELLIILIFMGSLDIAELTLELEYIYTRFEPPQQDEAGATDVRDEYQADEYDYTDEDEDYQLEEQPLPNFFPQFTTKSGHYKVEPGHTIRLPCEVDKLGPMVISWKKVTPHTNKNDQYLATGGHLLKNDERFSMESIEDKGSTLVIALAELTDVGYYVCEVSSNPPASLRHEVSIIVPPTVQIVRPGNTKTKSNKQSDVLKLSTGDELNLICHGSGDPEPQLYWSRKQKAMPDGQRTIEGSQIIFKNVTRKHAGVYICTGRNGPGNPAESSIRVIVYHAPEIITEESYIQKKESVQLELLCIVHASPKAKVIWYKDGNLIPQNNTSGRLTTVDSGSKHLLVIENVVNDLDLGIYTCHATNELGEAKGNINVLGPVADRSMEAFSAATKQNLCFTVIYAMVILASCTITQISSLY